MSNQNESLPEAPSAQHPHPAQTPAVQGEEMEQEATVNTSQTPTDPIMEASAAAASGVASVDGATTDDTEGDEALALSTQSAPGKGGSCVAGFATPEFYPPTPRHGSLDASATAQKMQRKLEKPPMSDLPPCPEEVPIEDPCEHRGHVDESRVLRTGKKQRNQATEGIDTDANETRSQADNDQAASAETQDVLDIFGDEPSSDQSSPAPQTTPGAVAVPGINSNNDDMEFANHEQTGQETPRDTASDIEAAQDSQEATLQVTGAHVVTDRGQDMGMRRNTPTDSMLREHLFAEVPIVSGEAIQDLPENPEGDVTSRKCSPREYSRRTLLIFALFVAIILAAATLMGVLIPQGSTAASQEGSQGSQSGAAPSSIPTSFPSHLPSLSPTDPDTLRWNSVRSILVPISGLEVLLDTATPQYRALEWLSLNDTLRLPYITGAERKRVIQRYVLAVLYYGCGGQHWHQSHHFLEGIHECAWWSWVEQWDGTVAAEGALCTKGYEVGEIDHLHLFDNNLTGSLPAELQYLSDLGVFVIMRNKIGGPIPGFIENMTSLTRLSLTTSMHTGTIPSSLGRLSNLEELSLYGNGLTGTIPESFGKLTSLQWLELSSNMLNGTILSVLGQLSNLDILGLDRNRLTGTIPESFGNLTSSVYLYLSSNMLNGTIPSVLGQLSGLGRLYLDGNRLTGEIPNEICRRDENPGDLTLRVDSLTANGTEFLCECIPVEGLSGCCVVRPNEVGNGSCEDDEPYNTAACGWDGGDCLVEGLPECLGIDPSHLGDGYCKEGYDDYDYDYDYDYDRKQYNTEACGYDGGDCCESTCKGSGCGNNGFNSCKDPTVNITCLDADGLEGCCVEYPSKIGDGFCHPYAPYYTEACKYDNGDCPAACPEGTFPVAGKNMSACCVEHPGFIGNGLCNDLEPLNTEACGFDGGDCCESTCEGSVCGWYGYPCKDSSVNIACLDANGLEGCCVEYPSQIGDGHCHPYEPYYTEACKYDNGDCPTACPEGTSPVAGKNMSACCVGCPACVGDGWCYNFEPYNTAACGWDGGDCCEETCEGWSCGWNEYDSCKDPSISN